MTLTNTHEANARAQTTMSAALAYIICIVGTVDGRGYNGQQKYTIFDVYTPCHLILIILKLVFTKFNRHLAFITHSGTYISRFGDFCVHDNANDDNNRTDLLYPLCMHTG